MTKMHGNDHHKSNEGILVGRVYNTVIEDSGANSAVIVTRGDGIGSIMSMFPRASLIIQK